MRVMREVLDGGFTNGLRARAMATSVARHPARENRAAPGNRVPIPRFPLDAAPHSSHGPARGVSERLVCPPTATHGGWHDLCGNTA